MVRAAYEWVVTAFLLPDSAASYSGSNLGWKAISSLDPFSFYIVSFF